LRRAIIVILDNPSSHKIAGVREATEAPPGLSAPYSPDLNRIAQAFAWLKGAAAQNRRRLDRLRTVGSPLYP